MCLRSARRVTVIEMAPRLTGREDEDVSAAIKAILEAEGIAFRLNATCMSVAKQGNGVAVHVSCEQEPRDIVGSHLLLAVGRVPNTHDLGLDKDGVQTDSRSFLE